VKFIASRGVRGQGAGGNLVGPPTRLAPSRWLRDPTALEGRWRHCVAMMRAISLTHWDMLGHHGRFRASQNAASSEIDVRWPAMVNERLTGRLIAARSCCVTAAQPLERPPRRCNLWATVRP
jgi:hypothetical protein